MQMAYKANTRSLLLAKRLTGKQDSTISRWKHHRTQRWSMLLFRLKATGFIGLVASCVAWAGAKCSFSFVTSSFWASSRSSSIVIFCNLTPLTSVIVCSTQIERARARERRRETKKNEMCSTEMTNQVSLMNLWMTIWLHVTWFGASCSCV